MSTYYYDMRAPWGKVEVDENSSHCRVTLWDSQGSRAGTLILPPEDVREAIHGFFREIPVYQVYSGRRGATLRKLRKTRGTTLLSERGVLTTEDDLGRRYCSSHDMTSESTLDESA